MARTKIPAAQQNNMARPAERQNNGDSTADEDEGSTNIINQILDVSFDTEHEQIMDPLQVFLNELEKVSQEARSDMIKKYIDAEMQDLYTEYEKNELVDCMKVMEKGKYGNILKPKKKPKKTHVADAMRNMVTTTATSMEEIQRRENLERQTEQVARQAQELDEQTKAFQNQEKAAPPGLLRDQARARTEKARQKADAARKDLQRIEKAKKAADEKVAKAKQKRQKSNATAAKAVAEQVREDGNVVVTVPVVETLRDPCKHLKDFIQAKFIESRQILEKMEKVIEKFEPKDGLDEVQEKMQDMVVSFATMVPKRPRDSGSVDQHLRGLGDPFFDGEEQDESGDDEVDEDEVEKQDEKVVDDKEWERMIDLEDEEEET